MSRYRESKPKGGSRFTLDGSGTKDYRWLLASTGVAKKALELLDVRLFASPGIYREWLRNNPYDLQGSLLERIYFDVALADWEGAEKDIERFWAVSSDGPCNIQFYFPARLLQGFLRERRGDIAGAHEAWNRGRIRSYVREAPHLAGTLEPSPSLGHLVYDLMMASLTNDLPESELDSLLKQFQSAVGEESMFGKSSVLIRPSAATLRKAFQTPRGREIARRIAFRQVSLPEYLRLPAYPLGAQFLIDGAGLVAPTPDQETLVWKLIEEGGEMYFRGQIPPTMIVSIGLAWKGQTGFLGWGGVLAPNIRGPAAYLIGLRYVRVLKKPADAVKLFQTARDDAVPGSPLRTLAEAELARLMK